MMAYRIDDNVPVPTGHQGRSGPVGDALKALNVGGSFFVPGRSSASIGGSINYSRMRGKDFTTLTATEPHPDTGEPVKGVRVWRTA